MKVDISVLIPLLNEGKFIEGLIDSFKGNRGVSYELILIDGGSTDDTREKVQAISSRENNVFLVDNPMKYVSHGFNKAFPSARGKYIALLGAHADYPSDFLGNAVTILATNECDAVGGPLVQKGKTIKGQAIAWAMSSRVGVGNTPFRTSEERKLVETVAFAVYKREIFDKIGLLDEQLVRNQDDEFHYRINAAGFRILMEPSMKCVYYVRESFAGLFSQYFQYGLYKPLVLRKVMSGIRVRHLVPAAFVAYLVVLPLLIAFLGPLTLLPLGVYVALIGAFSLRNPNSVGMKLYTFMAFVTIHVSYGAGSLLGISKLLERK